MKILRFSSLMICCFFSAGLFAQFAMHMQYPHRNDFNLQLHGEVALIHEKTSVVKSQQGLWNFELQPNGEAGVYLFQAENQLTEYIRFRKEGRVAAHVYFDYEVVAGKMMVSQVRDGKSTVSFAYDATGQLVGIRNMFSERLLSRSVFDYASGGEAKEYIVMDDQTFYFQYETVDGAPQKMSKVDSVSGTAFQANFSYNERAYLERAESYFSDENLARTILEYSYQLDTNGNWIKRLEHNRANGIYRLTERHIVYQDDLEAQPEITSPLGIWSCGTVPYYLQVMDNGQFTLFDLGEGDVYQGKWSEAAPGRYRFQVNQDNPVGSPYPLRAQTALWAKHQAGRLILYVDSEYHFDFVHESIWPVSDELRRAMRRGRWSKNRYSKDPVLKKEASVPEDIAAAFDEVRNLGPDHFQACLAGKCGVINRSGAVIIPFAYELLDMMDQDLYRITADGKQGVINVWGDQILPAKYDRIWAEPKLGRRVIGTRLAGERYYYDLDRGDFLPFEKEQLREFNDSRWVIREGRFVNLYDKDFNRLSQDSSYNRIIILSPRRYLAGGQDAYRILDENGQELKVFTGFLKVKPATFGYLIAFSATTRQYALFNQDGEQITEALYQELNCCDSRNAESNDCLMLSVKPAIARFTKANGQVGMLTALGQEVR